MRKYLAVLWATFAVACTAPPAQGEFVAKVQAIAVETCDFRPSVRSIAAIHAKGNAVLNDDPRTMALAICQARKELHDAAP